MPAAQGKGSTEGADAPKAALAPPATPARAGLSRGDGAAALALITAPLRSGDGYRHLWLGNTGMGKTWAARILAAQPGQLTLIHDTKRHEPEFPGVKCFTDVAGLLSVPADEARKLTAVAFRGDPYRGIVCEVEETSALALRLARAGIPVRLVVDETNSAMSDTGRTLLAPSLRICATEGRVMGLSISAAAQEVMFMPRVLYTQASSAGLFRVESADVNYLRERLYWDPEMLEVAAELEVGEFVIRRPATPWDRTVYRF